MASPQFQLDIVIIGAGIAGTATATCLAQKGHRVRLLEAKRTLSELGAGIQIQPNSSRPLYAWGLKDAFRQCACAPDVLHVKRYDTGEVIGVHPFNPAAEEMYGYPSWVVHRPDYQRILAQAALDAGAQIEFSIKIARIEVEACRIHLEDGTTINCDLIVGADGIRSSTRTAVNGGKVVDPIPVPEYTYRAIVPRERMMSNPQTAELMTSGHMMTWWGPGRSIVSYAIAAGQFYNMVIAVPRASDAPIAAWNAPGDVREMRETFTDFDPTVRTLLEHVDSCAKWVIAELPSLESWVSPNGRVVLVGDAAHAMTPHAAQGGAQSIEDAAVLGECLSRVKSLQTLPKALSAYEQLRKPRAERVQNLARGNAGLMTLLDGPEQQTRDQAFKKLKEIYEKEARLTEAEKKALPPKTKPKPDMNARWLSPENNMWLAGYDCIAEARNYLDQFFNSVDGVPQRL